MTIPEKVITLKDSDAERLRAGLEKVYAEVPATACECDRPGQCCELTEEEMRADFATMYPLYAAEYANIVAYVRERFSPADQDRLLGLTEERPTRCPFLVDGGRCGIHPVRPLTCRTYGVLRREHLAAAARRNNGLIPLSSINGFLAVESSTVCLDSRVLDPERMAGHEDRMIQGTYDRALSDLGGSFPPVGADRQDTFTALTGLSRIVKWTWGGFNALARTSDTWFRERFGDYWKRSELAE